MNNSLPIRIGRYHLAPLVSIRKDDISSMLGPEPGVYISEYPKPEWHKRFGLRQTRNYALEKPRCMFLQMAEGSKWVSPTRNVPKGKSTKEWQNEGVLYLAYKPFPCHRLANILQAISLLGWLWRYRREYSYCLVYNFIWPIYLAALGVKVLLHKPFYIDFEDDYTTQRKNWLKDSLESLVRRTVDGAICTNEHMTRYFIGKPVRVVNCFADLEYSKSADFSFKDGMIFLFSSALDNIRGADLIPDLVRALRQHIKEFKVLITGTGPLRPMVEGWEYPEVKYLGFLPDEDYASIIKQADACLVLQKPDHPFSLGSFPSKIGEYAKYKKPIFILRRG